MMRRCGSVLLSTRTRERNIFKTCMSCVHERMGAIIVITELSPSVRVSSKV